MIFDDTQNSLGEGPLWHPLRQSLLWFDINNKLMFERGLDDEKAQIFEFDEQVSAAGWIDKNRIIIASETALFEFELDTQESRFLVALENENPRTRSNDGRADPHGGFWIGTMGKMAETGAGAIYRYFDGELRKLYSQITISNSICFAPDGKTAYFCDTFTQKIQKVALDENGWPIGEAEIFVNVAPYIPDGSVVDAQGRLWNAQWGAGRVACYDENGHCVEIVEFPAKQTTCPAFGGKNLNKLFVTSASENLRNPSPHDGQTFVQTLSIEGQSENRVKL